MKKNWLEWSVFAASLAIVAGTIGYLIHDIATAGSSPPDLEIRLGRAERRSQYFVIPVSVANHGERAAEGVRISVTLESGGRERERAELELELLPRGAHREGWVAFETDPDAAERVRAVVVSYLEP